MIGTCLPGESAVGTRPLATRRSIMSRNSSGFGAVYGLSIQHASVASISAMRLTSTPLSRRARMCIIKKPM